MCFYFRIYTFIYCCNFYKRWVLPLILIEGKI
jgi:hypothetical protein